MDRDTVRRCVEQYVAMYRDGRAELAHELIAPEFVDHVHPDGPRGPEGVAAEVARAHSIFADISVALLDCIIEGDRVAFRMLIEGTHVGEWGGLAPSHRRVRFTAIDVAHLRDGKFVELWSEQDLTSLARQIRGTEPHLAKTPDPT